MSRAPASFTEADLRRAVRVAKDAGRVVEVQKGETIIRLFDPARPVDGQPLQVGPKRRITL